MCNLICEIKYYPGIITEIYNLNSYAIRTTYINQDLSASSIIRSITWVKVRPPCLMAAT